MSVVELKTYMHASHIRITVAASELTLGATAYGGRQTPRDRWLGGLALSKATYEVCVVIVTVLELVGRAPGGGHKYVSSALVSYDR